MPSSVTSAFFCSTCPPSASSGMIAELRMVRRPTRSVTALASAGCFRVSSVTSWREDETGPFGAISATSSRPSSTYASVTSVTPDAYVDDGRLDVALIAPNGPVSSSRQLVTLLTRKHPAEASAVTDRVGRLTIRSSAIIPLEADGGQVEQKKAEVTDEGISY